MSEVVDKAYELIRSRIISGDLVGGSRLKEEDLAKTIGVSRTPVREALRRLKADGLVDAPSNKGARVVSWSADDLAEITDLRAILESFGAGLAARKMTDEAINELQAFADHMEKILAQRCDNYLIKISEKNNQFHQLIIDTTGNRRLAATIHKLADAPLILRKFSVLDELQLRRSFSHHREIIDALRNRDPYWAKSIMRTHILAGRSADRVLELDIQNED
jgi:DNA-binding GntR family transcriptional regulator